MLNSSYLPVVCINTLQDADTPKEAKAVEVAEATFSEPAPAPSESEPAKEETTETTLPLAVRHASNLMFMGVLTIIHY